MSLYCSSDAILCKVFPIILGTQGSLWFNKLSPRSIRSFRDLERAFLARFVTSNKARKEVDSLISLRKRPDETLRQYADRYWELFNEINNCDQKIDTSSFKLGLESESPILQELMLHPPETMDELMKMIDKFCQLEDLLTERATTYPPQ